MPIDSYTVAGIIRRNELETELYCPLSKRKNSPAAAVVCRALPFYYLSA